MDLYVSDFDFDFVARVKRSYPHLFGPKIKLLTIMPDSLEKPSGLQYLWDPDTYKFLNGGSVTNLKESALLGVDYDKYNIVVSKLGNGYYSGRLRDFAVSPTPHIILAHEDARDPAVFQAFASMDGELLFESRPLNGGYWYGAARI